PGAPLHHIDAAAVPTTWTDYSLHPPANFGSPGAVGNHPALWLTFVSAGGNSGTLECSYLSFGTQEPPASHTITASAGAHGTITPSGAVTVSDGADQSFTIAAATGYHIADVLVDSVSVGAVSVVTFSAVNADHTISASFAINTYSITVSAS